MSAAGLTPERWALVKQVLQATLELPTGDRSAYLQDACGSDDSLRREVESLMAAHDQASGFLSAPLPLPANIPDHLAPGQLLGQYQILQVIGEGGMGTVYQALREDIRKLVAIKLVKRSMHSEFVLNRFARERQILAHFDHPNITKFLDTGLTNDGRPFFVMEFIAGSQIDVYCDSHRLTTRDRLQLFLKVCGGVEYAHRNLVVHRDLKPRNILVTEEGDPKLLDFGIAKILEEDPTTGSAHDTVTIVRMMTPQYASPEQARGEHVSTASDVYSLGVLLYELLTGHRPYNVTGRPALEVAEVICRVDPALPSAVVRRTQPQDIASGTDALSPESVSATRDGRPAKLIRALSGDLDNILLKALQKRPEQRYASVAHFADDVQRHLDGLPVLAHDATVRYRAAKFVGRHKAGVLAAGLVFLSLVGGLAATLRQERIANAERARAERRFQDVRALANSLLFEVYGAIQDLPGSTPARELLLQRALRYLDSLASESSGDAGLRRELAAAYEKVGDVQGGYRTSNLGNTAGAIESYRKALEIRQSLPADAALQRELIRNHGKLGDVLMQTGRAAEAVAHSRQLLTLATALADANPGNREDQANLAAAYLDAGSKQTGGGDWKAGLESSRKSVALFEKLAADKPDDADTGRRLAVAYERTGSLLASRAQAYGEALALHHKEMALTDKLSAAAPLNPMLHRLAAYARISIANDLDMKDDHAGAQPYYEAALAELRRISDADPKNFLFRMDVVNALASTAEAALAAGDSAKGIARLRESTTLLAGMPLSPESAAALAANQVHLGEALLHAGRRGEARSFYEQALTAADPAVAQRAREGLRQCDAGR